MLAFDNILTTYGPNRTSPPNGNLCHIINIL